MACIPRARASPVGSPSRLSARFAQGVVPLLALTLTTIQARAQAPTRASARLRLGAGLTQRLVTIPSQEGPRQLDFGPAAAVLLGIDGDLRRGRLALGLSLSYRTSLAGRVADTLAGAGANTSRTAVRSHLFEAGLRTGLYLGADPHAIGVSLFGGYNVRAFSSVAVLRVPRFSLHGPVLRFELDLPLTVGHMRLRLAPEAQWIVSITQQLRQIAGILPGALAFAGEAMLTLPLSDSFLSHLHYRESHAVARTRYTMSFTDIERYLLFEVSYKIE